MAPPALPPPPPLDATVKYQVITGGVLIGYSTPLVADLDGDGKPEIIVFEGNSVRAAHGDTGEILFHAAALPAPYEGCALYGKGMPIITPSATSTTTASSRSCSRPSAPPTTRATSTWPATRRG
jgi:hypothetical protein